MTWPSSSSTLGLHRGFWGLLGRLERHLRNEPTRVSKSRIKRLRGLSQPQYRIRVGEVRVFYDVTREAVEVLAIVTKAEAGRWLAEHGTPSAPSSPG
jgi:mRNA interferase RelE/StbE